MKRILPCLWFENQAEEAVRYYVSIFKNSKIESTSYFGVDGPLPAGTVLTITFQLNGEEFMALNGGQLDAFNHSVSFLVNCDTQDEIDHYWDNLVEGGEAEQCGWLKDRYGVSWQIVPSKLGEYLDTKDQAAANRVMQVVYKMIKPDLKLIEEAYNQK